MSSLSIFVYEEVIVSEVIALEIVFVAVAIRDCLTFSAKELAGLRGALRTSIGRHADDLSDEYLSDFGTSMLQATAIVLKAKHPRRATT